MTSMIRVLLVEDEPLIRLGTGELLRDAGFEVVEAEDGPNAVRLIDENPDEFDVILTDFQMPGPLNGVQVAIHARKRRPAIRVVVLSAHALEASRLDGLGLPKVFISKPFELRTLVDVLRMVVEQDA